MEFVIDIDNAVIGCAWALVVFLIAWLVITRKSK